MHKKTYSNIHLFCTLQQDNEITQDKCLSGVISKTGNGFHFEEAVRIRRPRRNPKLFEGQYISLVHLQNGKYRVHMRNIDANGIGNSRELAFRVYSEMLNAFDIIG